MISGQKRVRSIGVAGLFILAAAFSTHAATVYDTNYKSIVENWSVPEWYEDGKFGLYVHWGIFQVPTYTGGSIWFYGDEMYDAADPVFAFHQKTYGNQKTFGYKDFIPLYKMDKFDPEAWADVFLQSGAKWVMPIAIFHDGVPNYKSKVIPKFNLVNYPGSCGKDITAMLGASVRKRGLKFGVTNQYLENWGFYCHNSNYDTDDPANLELYNNGTGGVCGGLFYNGYNNKVAPNSWLVDKWLASHYETVDMFQPDLIFFDMATQPGYNHLFDGNHLKPVLTAYYYNKAVDWGKQVALNMKVQSMPEGTHIEDEEWSAPVGLQNFFWQTDTPLGGTGWCHSPNYRCSMLPHNAIRLLAQNTAFNGCLLLAFGNRPDGMLDSCIAPTLKGIGNWLGKNGESIYGTRPWKIQSEGPKVHPDSAGVGVFGNNYSNRDYFYTADKAWTKIYVIGMAWPTGSLAVLTSLKSGSFNVTTIDSISLLNSTSGKLTYTQDATGLRITLPGTASPIADAPYALRIALKMPARDAFAKIEAESYNNKRLGAIKIKTCSEGGQCLDSARTNDWAAYANVNFGANGANKFTARVSAATVANSNIASIEVHLDSLTGPAVGKLTGSCPGGVNNYTTLTYNFTEPVVGAHNLFLVWKPGFRSYNLNWFQFTEGPVSTRPALGASTIHAGLVNEKIDLYDLRGRLVASGDKARAAFNAGASTGTFSRGIYIRKATVGNVTSSAKLYVNASSTLNGRKFSF